MSNPLRAPKTLVLSMESLPDAYFTPDEEYDTWVRQARQVERIQRCLSGLDMDVVPTITIPKDLCADAAVLQKKGPALAVAKVGKPVFRVRSSLAKKVGDVAWRHLPDVGFGSKELVAAAVRDRFCVDGGAECALGRMAKAYPKQGASIARPVTRAEAERALDNCGVRVDHLPPHAVDPYPLVAREGAGALMVNPRSDNGFPVMAKWESSGASEKALGLAVTVRREIAALARSPGGLDEWYRRAQEERPWLVACKGKAKGDYYSAAKIRSSALRFYNALPRQIMLNMQVATQPLEAVSRSAVEGTHSALGVSLVHGGANDLVVAMDEQLERLGHAYVHLGDDSWVVVRSGTELVWFALDCSNFDLTQHASATREVHEALRRQLRTIDAPAADLWFQYARQRLVVVAGAVARRFKHAGPSGMPLQSKVNDMLMDVLINRVLQAAPRWRDESAVDAALMAAGRELGFAVRVEQFARIRADTIFEALEQQPFLFVGYYFHVRNGSVLACIDVPRTLAQMPYPGLKWMRTDKEVEVMEAMRLGSIVLSMGLPPRELELAFASWRAAAHATVEQALAKYGEQEATDLRWAVAETPWGPEVIPSLRGLSRALGADPRALWLEPRYNVSLRADPVLVNWADEVDEAEQEAVAAKEVYVAPAAAPLPRALPAPSRPAPTHPVTRANDGRPPPTARWGPNRPPRAPREEARPASRRKARRGRVAVEEIEEEWWTEDEDGYSS